MSHTFDEKKARVADLAAADSPLVEIDGGIIDAIKEADMLGADLWILLEVTA